MKKALILCLAFFMLGASFAVAQDRPTNWFIGAGAGMNIGFDGQSFITRESSHIGAGTAADFYVGKYFGQVVGFRAGYQGFVVSNQYIDYGKVPFHYAHADLLFRVASGFVPYVHAGYAKLNSGSPAGGIGVMFPIHISKRVAIVPDIKATALNGAAYPGGTKRIAGNISGTIGLQIALGKIKEKKVEEPVVLPLPVAEPQPEPKPAKPEPVVETPPQPVTPPMEQIKEKEEQINKSLSQVVLFQTNSFNLSPEACKILDEAVAFMKKYPMLKAHIDGHTDSTGGEQLNLTLSDNRAKAVADYLIGQGVPSSAITYQGYGKSNPVAPNNTKEGRAANRRVQISIGL